MDDPIGQLGNYRVLRLLGQGAFADVYLGEHIHLRTQAAIKVLQVRLVESNIQSFLNEARTIAHLVHPYIIRVLDFGVEANTPFLVMDYASRGTFRQRFLQGKPLPPASLFPYIKQAASALQYAHDKKLVHRDVKPENMLLGPHEEILLSDFGFAVIQTSISRPSSETAGTVSYMAPEQFQGKAQPASDQYSLGVIAYEWLAGVCPFQGTFMELSSQHMIAQPPSLLQRVPGLSAQVAQVVMTALAKEPDQRFPTVRDFARALEHACGTSSANLTSSSPSVSSPFLATNPGLNTSLTGTSWAGTSLAGTSLVGANPVPTTDHHNPQPIPHSAYQPPDAFQRHLQSSQHSRSGLNSFPPALTIGPPSPEQALSSSFGTFQQEKKPLPSPSSFGAFQQEQTPPSASASISASTSAFTPLSQSGPNAVQSSQPNPRSFSSWQTERPTTSHPGQSAPNMQHAIENFSLSGLPPLQPQHIAQHLNEFTNAHLNFSEQLFSSAPSLSQSHLPPLSELPPLPQQPFLAPELAKQNRQAPMTSQTFPVQQNASRRTSSPSQTFSAFNGVPPLNVDSLPQPDPTVLNEQPSPFSASGQKSTPEPTPVVRTQDFRVRPKSPTSDPLRLFVICMVVLIIASTAILVTLTNYLHNGSKSLSAPHTYATATTASQQTTQTPSATPTPQTEQNPYGNHNGVLVLNDPLNQQNQQLPWDDSPGFCSFSAGSYHVVAGPQAQRFTLCNATATDYANFVYQVQMTLTKATSTGDSGGLVLRGNIPNSQFYFLEIFTTGNYGFYRCPGTKGTCATLANSTTTGAGPIHSFHTGLNQPNTVAVVANGNTFAIYVNNELVTDPIVDTVADPAYSHGSIGMMAREKNVVNAITDVSFNDVKIWKL